MNVQPDDDQVLFSKFCSKSFTCTSSLDIRSSFAFITSNNLVIHLFVAAFFKQIAEEIK